MNRLVTSAALAALVLLAAQAGLAQDAALVLRVRSAADLAPVASARLQLMGARRLGHTDARGGAILGVPLWPDTLVVTAIGFAPARVVLTGPLSQRLEILLKTAPVVLPELVTTAGRRVQRAGETPLAVTTVERRELDAAAASGLNDAVGELAGVQVAGRQPAGTTVQIRGLGDSRVLVLVDGEPVAGALLDNRDLSRTSTIGVERIEITKGPTSVQHGSDALGGVINVVTAAPEGPLTIGADVLAGGPGRREGRLSLTAGGPIGVRLSGGMRQEERVAGQGEDPTSLERIWDLRSTVRARAGTGWELRGDFNFDRTRQRWPANADFNGFVDTWAAGGFVESSWERPWGGLRTRLFGQSFQYQFRQAAGSEPIADGGASPQRERLLRALVGYSRAFGGHRLDTGVEGALRQVDAKGYIAGDVADDQQVDVYAQDAWSTGRWLLNGGTRVSHNSRWGSTVTPSLGAAVELSPRFRLTSSLARGFRGPSTKELAWTFANLGAGYIIQGNPDLRPESSWSLSAGARWAPTDGLLAEADVFRNELRNLVDFASGGFTPGGLLIFTPRNVQRARTEGAELSLRGAAGGWIGTGSYAYLNAVDRESGLPLPLRAKHTARVRLTRQVKALSGAAIDLTGRYTGPAAIVTTDSTGAEVESQRQAGFLALDLQGSVRPWSGLELAVGVDNLLDRRPANWPGDVSRRAYVAIRTQIRP